MVCSVRVRVRYQFKVLCTLNGVQRAADCFHCVDDAADVARPIVQQVYPIIPCSSAKMKTWCVQCVQCV